MSTTLLGLYIFPTRFFFVFYDEEIVYAPSSALDSSSLYDSRYYSSFKDTISRAAAKHISKDMFKQHSNIFQCCRYFKAQLLQRNEIMSKAFINKNIKQASTIPHIFQIYLVIYQYQTPLETYFSQTLLFKHHSML